MTVDAWKELAALERGDVVEFDGESYELLGAPFLGRSGGSVFDEHKLFWRAQIRSLRDPRDVRYGTWYLPTPQD